MKVKTAIAGNRCSPEIRFDKYPRAVSPGFSNPRAAKRVDLGAKPFTMAIGLSCFTGAVKFFVMNARPALAATSGLGFAEYPTPSRGVEWVDYSKRPFGGPEAVLAALYPPRRHLPTAACVPTAAPASRSSIRITASMATRGKRS